MSKNLTCLSNSVLQRKNASAKLRAWGFLTALLLCNGVGSAEPETRFGHTDSKAPVAIPVTIDLRNGGRVFNGIGGVGGGSSTRLLIDYPEPARSEILDYLFKPNFGAALQIFKVEIPGDMNSTVGSGPSHRHSRDEMRCDVGIDWWLLKEARKRNPDLVLAALQWGAPGWIRGGFWSQDNIDYIISWLDCAESHGLEFEYVGGWNESGFEAQWFVKLAAALKEKHPGVKIIAADDLPHHDWRIARAMNDDLAVNDAIDVLGQHSPGGWRSLYQHYSAPPEALRLGKPLWTSEQSALSHDVGGGPWARGINRAYIDARITASLNWSPASAWYSNLHHADTGQVLAEWPWSGYYAVANNIWAYAHTTQFTKPGWQYVDSACGYMPNGASYVTLKSPGADQFSTVIETLDSTAPLEVRFALTGMAAPETIHVWKSNFNTRNSDDDFIEQNALLVKDGYWSIDLEPGHVYTLSTLTGQAKGSHKPMADVWAHMPLPLEESFDSYEAGKYARYFSDMNGSFETAPAADGREGLAYRQVATTAPIAWNLTGAGSLPPTIMVGDPGWWGDYEIKTDVWLEKPGHVKLIGRISSHHGAPLAGYHLRVDTDGKWQIISQNLKSVSDKDVELTSGTVAFPVGKWHTLALRMTGDQIDAIINGEVVGGVKDQGHLTGNAALQLGPWQYGQFDNFRISTTAVVPRFVPQRNMKATATTERPYYRGDVFPAEFAIDGRPESFWLSERETHASLPQSITVNLNGSYQVEGLVYQPRIDNVTNGIVTGYIVYLSRDGKTFEKAAEGEWPVSSSSKMIKWPVQKAAYVRLEAVNAVNDAAAVGELNIIEASQP